jgi:phosphatidate phosphatase APP1
MRKFLYRLLQLSDEPVIKVYNGYGDHEQLVIYGSAFKLSPLPRQKYSGNVLSNAIGILRLFMVRPYPKMRVRILWNEHEYDTETEPDGFFRFEWKPDQPMLPGWHPVQVKLMNPNEQNPRASGEGKIFIPNASTHAFVSDIDDTFLISHSTNLRKRLFVLLTENAHSRKPFDGVVNHYQLLAKAGRNPEESNPFFYVSSSEWNLYDYIRAFAAKNELPEGIYLLNQLKRFSEVWRTGKGAHATKFTRIARIIETYPLQKYILLGDDSQDDPKIYASLAEHFPGNIMCVYLRRIKKSKETVVNDLIAGMEKNGVACCYFTHSAEAIEHSRQVGLIR